MELYGTEEELVSSFGVFMGFVDKRKHVECQQETSHVTAAEVQLMNLVITDSAP